MATSTFYENIVIGEDAAKILAKGLKAPKPPRRPPAGIELEMSDDLLKQYRTNLKRVSAKEKKN